VLTPDEIEALDTIRTPEQMAMLDQVLANETMGLTQYSEQDIADIMAELAINLEDKI
jgi:hypothetical protein